MHVAARVNGGEYSKYTFVESAVDQRSSIMLARRARDGCWNATRGRFRFWCCSARLIEQFYLCGSPVARLLTDSAAAANAINCTSTEIIPPSFMRISESRWMSVRLIKRRCLAFRNDGRGTDGSRRFTVNFGLHPFYERLYLKVMISLFILGLVIFSPFSTLSVYISINSSHLYNFII